jgi:hypothetical protein
MSVRLDLRPKSLLPAAAGDGSFGAVERMLAPTTNPRS